MLLGEVSLSQSYEKATVAQYIICLSQWKHTHVWLDILNLTLHMYINHTPDSCTPLRNKKLLKSSSGLLVQNRSRDKSMKREQALEKKKKPEQKGFIFCLAHFWLTLLLYQAVFLSVVFTLFMWKESTNEFRFLPRLAAMVIWGSNTQTMTMLT